MGSPNSQVSHIGMILANINVNSTVARRNTNSATKDELKGKPVKHPKVWMVRIAKDECGNFHRQMKIDANKDTDLAAFSKRGFKSDLTALVFYCIIRYKKKPTRYTKPFSFTYSLYICEYDSPVGASCARDLASKR